MPPPDVDLAAWHDSIDRVRQWAPERLFVTHFGPHTDVDRHLDVMDEEIDAFADKVEATLSAVEPDGRDAVAQRFADRELDRLRATTDERFWDAYEQFGQPRESWYGLARYWQKHLESRSDG